MALNNLLSKGMLAAAVVLITACSSPSSDSRPQDIEQASEVACLADSPWLQYGEGLHASDPNVIPSPASVSPVRSVEACDGSSEYRFGAGKADITGGAAGKILLGMESPTRYTQGIYTRQYARSFITGASCNDKRAVLVVVDTGLFYESERKEVVARLQADPAFGGRYGDENVMINATHTHSGPGGQAHHLAYNTLRLGFDEPAFEVTVSGIVESVRRAHEAFENSSSDGKILLNQGELLGANKNRAIPAYMNNPESERALYVDVKGDPIFTPRLMSLLKFVRNNGEEVGALNWFGVHPTADFLHSDYGGESVPISGDHKGYAAVSMEKMFSHSNPGFVAAFSQADEGDSFADLFFDNPEEKNRQFAFLPPHEPAPVTVSIGQKQLLSAVNLYRNAADSLNGPVDYRFRFVAMDQVEVTDEFVLASLIHPPELDTDPKRTCSPALGVSFGAAGEGTPPGEVGGFTPAGVTCPADDPLGTLTADLGLIFGGALPANLVGTAVGCNVGAVPLLNLGCHAEKPVLLPLGPPLNAEPSDIPLQIVRIGNLAVLGLPWEVTTMAGRRLRHSVLDVLKHDGVDYVVINGLSNGYMHYLTTREEYAIQQYEGGSNVFGPWSLAAVQQEFRKLAKDMVAGVSTDFGQAPQPLPPLPGVTTIQIADIPAPGTNFGDVLEGPEASYLAGETARALFQASSPNSDFKTGGSFLFVEKKVGDSWEVVALDADTETSFVWRTDDPAPQLVQIAPSRAEILWRIPRNTDKGTYRLRFESVANQLGILTPYSGTSSEFVVDGPGSRCP